MAPLHHFLSSLGWLEYRVPFFLRAANPSRLCTSSTYPASEATMEAVRPAIKAASRKFIFGSHAAFEELQQSIVATNEASLTRIIEIASAAYKKCIAIYAQDIIELSEQAETMRLGDEVQHFINVEINVAESIHQLWSLSDACLLSRKLPDKAVMWLKVRCTFCFVYGLTFV